MNERYFDYMVEGGSDIPNYSEMRWEFISYYRMWGVEV